MTYYLINNVDLKKSKFFATEIFQPNIIDAILINVYEDNHSVKRSSLSINL